MFALDLLEPAHQLVVFGVGDFRIVQDVVAMVVAIDLIAQPRNFRLEFFSLGGHGERVSQKGLEVT
jgi:hypothetical protein